MKKVQTLSEEELCEYTISHKLTGKLHLEHFSVFYKHMGFKYSEYSPFAIRYYKTNKYKNKRKSGKNYKLKKPKHFISKFANKKNKEPTNGLKGGMLKGDQEFTISRKIAPKINLETIIPTHFGLKSSIKLELMDCGSTGTDCLIRVINEYLEMHELDVYDIDTVYESLDLPTGVFLEDDSLSKILQLYKLNCFAITKFKGKDIVLKFNLGFENTIIIYNEYPFHYYLVHNIKLNGEIISTETFENLLINEFKSNQIELSYLVKGSDLFLTPESVDSQPESEYHENILAYGDQEFKLVLLDVQLEELQNENCLNPEMDLQTNIVEEVNIENLNSAYALEDDLHKSLQKVCQIFDFKLCNCKSCDKLDSFVYLNNLRVIIITSNNLVEYRLSSYEETVYFLLTDKLYLLFKLETTNQEYLNNCAEISIPPKGCTLEILYAYLLSVNDMVVTLSLEVLEAFRFCHFQIIDHIIDLQSRELYLPEYFIKAYLKLRHNIFSYICLDALGLNPNKLNTDVPLSKYINSTKTPDFILEDEHSIKIIEFCVGNKYETIDLIKGGGQLDIKYSYEASLIEEKYNKNCRVYIIPAVLDHANLDEIREILNNILPDIKFPVNLFKVFFNISNTHRQLINNSMYQVDKVSRNIIDFGEQLNYERPELKNIYLFNPEFINKLYSSNQSLLRYAYRYRGDMNAKFIFEYDIDRSRFSLRTDNTLGKLSFESAVDILENKQYSKILNNIKIIKSGKVCGLEELRGSVPFMISNGSRAKIENNWQEHNIIMNIFLDKTTNYVDEYGTPSAFNIDDLVNLRSIPDKVLFPPDYLERLKNIDLGTLLSSRDSSMLANNTIDDKHIQEALTIFKDEMEQLNSLQDIRYPKQTFMVPLVSYPILFSKESKWDQILRLYIDSGSGSYTKEILRRISNKQFVDVGYNPSEVSSELLDLKEKYNEKSEKYFTKVRKELKATRYQLMTSDERVKVRKEKLEMEEAKRNYQSCWAKTKRISWKNMVKLAAGKKSLYYSDFQKEMLHYKKRGSIYSGIGDITNDEYERFDLYIKRFIKRLTESEFCQNEYKPLFSTRRSPGNPFLTELKNMHTKDWVDFYNSYFKGTLLQQLCCIAQKLAIFLLNESVKSYGRDYVRCDHLGYEDFLVLVKGGSKIYKHQKSRLFRVMFYISPEDLVFSGYRDNKSFEILKNGTKYLVVTPWQQYHQDVLYDWMSLPERTFMNLYSAYTRSDVLKANAPSPMLYLPIILSLHNRRKTEKFMHNSRYLIVNLLGQFSNIKGIIKSFADFNYTYLEAWFRKRLELGYQNFSHNVMMLRNFKGNIDHMLVDYDVRDLWLNTKIFSADQLTTFIYITYMMTKAPVNSSLEQASNLWEILEDTLNFKEKHFDVIGLHDRSLRFSVLEFDSEVYKDDFKYDPQFCQYLGHYLSCYLKNECNKLELNQYWSRIVEQDIDKIANSNGLRGFRQSNFFNKKGYQVVYDYIDSLMDDDKMIALLEDIFDSDLATAQINISGDKIRYEDTDTFKKLIFHIVHKIQRGGGREIFCMDINTKSKQNPIEVFFKFLCKKIPNEFISVPSGKRHSIIHHDFYEKNPLGYANYIYRWVLDCRRWAPHSVFQKYCHFVHGMADILPSSFYNYFMKFAEQMFEKQFITREHVISKMRNNERFNQYSSLMQVSNLAADAISFTVPFSFVMGIFNYLSTILHASNQLLASEVIRDSMAINNYGLVLMDPKCHSDDSVVSSYHEKRESIRPSVLLYDWLLKGANHMLSVKKSQVNQNVYLEFLSILYLFDRFMPVLPKFSSTLPFKPSDRGYSSDIGFAITQSIEMLSQGGTFDESFLILKLTEQFIQNLYNYRTVPDLPFNFLGSIDSHPLELLYCGGLASIYSYLKYDKDRLLKSYGILNNLELLDFKQSEVSLKWDMSARLGANEKAILSKYKRSLQFLNEKAPWTIANCKLGNSKLNLLWYCNKLSDKSFYSSLVNEPQARKFARIFGSAGYRNIIAKNGVNYSVVKLISVLLTVDEINLDYKYEDFQVFNNYIEFMCQDLDYLYAALDNANIKEIIPSNLKDKPCVFEQGTSILGKVNLSPQSYTSYLKEFEGFKLLGIRQNPYRDVKKISQFLKQLGFDVNEFSADQTCAAAQKVLKQDKKRYNLICPIKGDKRRIESFTDVIGLIQANSFKNKQIVIHAKNAQLLDWQRKIIIGRVPRSVLRYLNLQQAEEILIDTGAIKKDILKVDIPKFKEEVLVDVPSEWKPFCSSYEKDVVLSNQYYWIYWEKEQFKMGYKWYGVGRATINLPEMELGLEIVSGVVEKLNIFTTVTGKLSKTTSWFLSCIFNLLDLNNEMVSSDFSLPTKIYLGYNENDQMYGIGFGKTFDTIFPNTNITDYSMVPLEFTTKMDFQKIGRYYNYFFNGNKYKIEKFMDIAKAPSIDFSELLDGEKLKTLLLNQDTTIKDFLTTLSKQLGIKLTVNREILINNFPSSLIYRIFRNYSGFQSVFAGEGKTDSLIQSLLEWKKISPEFGFPTEERLSEILQSKNLPPLPQRIFNMLKNLGHSNVSQEEFESIITKLAFLPDEERERYLISVMPSLSTSQVGQTLVIMKRSKYIFDKCISLNGKAWDILIPLLETISELVLTHKISSSYLSQLTIKMSENLNKNVTTYTYLMVLISRILLNSIVASVIHATDYLHVRQLLDIVQEFVDNGMLPLMNLSTTTQTYLNTIDFNVDKETFIIWLVDLLDCAFIESNRNKFMCARKNLKSILGEGGILADQFGKFKGTCMKLSFRKDYHDEDKLVLINKGKQSVLETKDYKLSNTPNSRKSVLDLSPSFPGVTQVDFARLEEESQEEFEEAFSYGNVDYDELEFLEGWGDLPKFLYTKVNFLTGNGVTSVRGGGQNVFIKGGLFLRNALKIKGDNPVYLKLFRKQPNYTSIYRAFDDYEKYIYYVGVENYKGSLLGYEELTYEQTMILTKPYKWERKIINIEGEDVVRLNIQLDPKYMILKEMIGNYFKQVILETNLMDVEKKEKILASVEPDIEVPEELTESIKELKTILKEQEDRNKMMVRQAVTQNIVEEEPIDQEKINEMIKRMLNLYTETMDAEKFKATKLTMLKDLRDINRNYSFSSPMEVISDPTFIAEFETLLPGYLDCIMKNELRLTKAQINNRIFLAKQKIALLPNALKKNYNTLLLFVFMVFTCIDVTDNAKADPISAQFCLAIDDLFNIDLGTENMEPCDLTPNEPLPIPIDIGFLNLEKNFPK